MDKEQVNGLDNQDVDWRSNFINWTVKPELEDEVQRFEVANSCTGAAGDLKVKSSSRINSNFNYRQLYKYHLINSSGVTLWASLI